MKQPNDGPLLSFDMPLPSPAAGTVPVWILLVPAAVSHCKRRSLFALLDPEERQRAWSIRCDERRAEFIAGHGWRRLLLSAVVGGVPPSAWRFSMGQHGRPLLVAGNAMLDVSLSHAAGAIAAAVAVGCRVGVDIEVADDDRPGEGHGEPAAGGASTSLRDWTLAEAIGKCLGEGLPEAFEIRHPRRPATDALRVSAFRRLLLVGDRRLHLAVAVAPMVTPPTPPAP